MAINTAIKPDYFNPLLKVHEEADSLGILPEENHLNALAQMAGWTELKDYIKGLQQVFDGLVKARMSANASKEEIGEAAILAELCKENLQRIINKVEDSKDAVESARERNSGGSD